MKCVRRARALRACAEEVAGYLALSVLSWRLLNATMRAQALAPPRAARALVACWTGFRPLQQKALGRGVTPHGARPSARRPPKAIAKTFVVLAGEGAIHRRVSGTPSLTAAGSCAPSSSSRNRLTPWRRAEKTVAVRIARPNSANRRFMRACRSSHFPSRRV